MPSVLSLLLLPLPALALSPDDLVGRWTGGQGCRSGLSTVAVSVAKSAEGLSFTYRLTPKGRRAPSAAGSGTFRNGRVQASIPKDNLLQIEQIEAAVEMDPESDEFSAKADLGLLEAAASLEARFKLPEPRESLAYTVTSRILGEEDECRGLLKRAGGTQKESAAPGPAPCPKGTFPVQGERGWACGKAGLKPKKAPPREKLFCAEGYRWALSDEFCIPYVCEAGKPLSKKPPPDCPQGTHPHPNDEEAIARPLKCYSDYSQFALKTGGCEPCADSGHAKRQPRRRIPPKRQPGG